MSAVDFLVEEEAAGIQIVNVAPGRGVLLLLPTLVVVVHLAVDEADGLLEGVGFQCRLDTECVKMSDAGNNVLGDVAAALSAGEPRPAAIVVLAVFQLLAGVFALFGHTMQVEEQGHILLA